MKKKIIKLFEFNHKLQQYKTQINENGTDVSRKVAH